MPNKKEDSDTEETSERPSGSESDDDTDPEDHKGAAKKQQATASSSEESDVSDAESDEEPAQQKKTETKKSSDSKEVSNISLKKANEPSDNAPAKKSAGKKSSKKDVKNEKQDEKKVTISETSGSKSTSSRGFGVRESFGTLREKRKSKKAKEAKDKEGIIQKKGNINRKWEKKYIIVSSASRTIYLYDLEPEQNERRANQAPKQVISLETAVIYARVQRRGAEMQSYFNIRANNRDYLFKAASPEEKSEWVAAIKSNKKKKEDDQVPIKAAGFQTPESQKKQDKNIEKASNIFLKLFGRESYLGVAKDS